MPGASMPMARQDNFGFHFFGACTRRVKIVNLKPKEDTVSVWFSTLVPYRAVVVLDFPAV